MVRVPPQGVAGPQRSPVVPRWSKISTSSIQTLTELGLMRGMPATTFSRSDSSVFTLRFMLITPPRGSSSST
jgi:hypothetical protein